MNLHRALLKARRNWHWVGGGISLLIWLSCAIAAPWLLTGGDWAEVQNVWDRWQALNVGVIAVVASAVALFASQQRVRIERQRRFVAARAFLPHLLAELHSYARDCLQMLKESLHKITSDPFASEHSLSNKVPALPQLSYVIEKNIENGPDYVGDYLARSLIFMQIYNSRLLSIEKNMENRSEIIVRDTIKNRLADTSVLLCIIETLFEFSRGDRGDDLPPPDIEASINALSRALYQPEDIDVFRTKVASSLKLFERSPQIPRL